MNQEDYEIDVDKLETNGLLLKRPISMRKVFDDNLKKKLLATSTNSIRRSPSPSSQPSSKKHKPAK